MSRLLRIRDVAERLNVSRETARLIVLGNMPHLRVGSSIRVPESAVEAHLATCLGPALSWAPPRRTA